MSPGRRCLNNPPSFIVLTETLASSPVMLESLIYFYIKEFTRIVMKNITNLSMGKGSKHLWLKKF